MNVTELYEAAARNQLLTPVTVGTATIQCAFRAPDETVFDGLALSRNYHIEYPTVWLTLVISDVVLVKGESYKVREVRQLRDGSESRATLSKL